MRLNMIRIKLWHINLSVKVSVCGTSERECHLPWLFCNYEDNYTLIQHHQSILFSLFLSDKLDRKLHILKKQSSAIKRQHYLSVSVRFTVVSQDVSGFYNHINYRHRTVDCCILNAHDVIQWSDLIASFSFTLSMGETVALWWFRNLHITDNLEERHGRNHYV